MKINQYLFDEETGVPSYASEFINEPQYNIALVIPVINEGDRIIKQLRLIHQLKPKVDIIIADGGSTDKSISHEILKVNGVTTLLTKIGQGRLSSQLRMAIHYVLVNEYVGLITMDGNGKDGVREIEDFVSALNDGFDFVQGSRFMKGGRSVNTPLIRYLSIRFLHSPLQSLGARHHYTDSTNGFRAHSRKFLEDPKVSPLRDVFESYELLAYLPIRASRLGYKIKEIPVARIYPRNKKIPTKITGMKSHFSLLIILIKAIVGVYNPKVD